jgi:hypothetical protein
MRSSLVVRAFDCQCTSCNGPGFDPSIRRHSGIWGAADEAVLNIVRRKNKKIKIPPQKNNFGVYRVYCTSSVTHHCHPHSPPFQRPSANYSQPHSYKFGNFLAIWHWPLPSSIYKSTTQNCSPWGFTPPTKNRIKNFFLSLRFFLQFWLMSAVEGASSSTCQSDEDDMSEGFLSGKLF